MGEITFQVIRILSVATITSIVAVLLAPLWTNFLYKHRLGKQIRTEGAPVFTSLHKKKEGTPTMGGVLIWGAVIVILIILAIGSFIFPNSFLSDFYFLSRAETLLPLGVLIFAALLGLVDDLLGIFRIGPKGGGLSMKHRLGLYTLVAVIAAWWFAFKLEWDVVSVPFLGVVDVGMWFIPIAIFIIIATSFSINETDGLDGLAGGILLVAFSSYGLLAFLQHKFDLATFCVAIAGALLAFLWFNIYPARFFMGDTGAMALGVTLGVVAILTNAILVLPLIAFIPMVETVSVIIQIGSKKLRGKKVFRSAPIHHHFQAIGWPETKVTERFWIISGVMAALGIIIYLLGG